MSESVPQREDESAPSRPQSGMQIWLACVLFIVVPVLLILLIKYFLGA